jgi:NTE family protein
MQALATATATLGGCSWTSGHDHAGADAPRALPLRRPARTAWVLGSGGPRGFVHVGVLKALDELQLKPDLVVGASIGAVVGTLRCAGLMGWQLEQMALDLQPLSFVRLAFGAPERFSGAALADFAREQTGHRRLEQLPWACACVVKRRQQGDAIAFTAGDVGLAVQAATAIEGQMAPVQIRGEWCCDADLVTPLPVRLARALGASRVLAVDVSAHEDKAPPGTERWREGDLRKRRLTEPDAASADLLLHPDTGYYASMSRDYRKMCMDMGYKATLAQADALRALHRSP